MVGGFAVDLHGFQRFKEFDWSNHTKKCQFYFFRNKIDRLWFYNKSAILLMQIGI
jgi:hypothetical protein